VDGQDFEAVELYGVDETFVRGQTIRAPPPHAS
jgi:hypothetical protein